MKKMLSKLVRYAIAKARHWYSLCRKPPPPVRKYGLSFPLFPPPPLTPAQWRRRTGLVHRLDPSPNLDPKLRGLSDEHLDDLWDGFDLVNGDAKNNTEEWRLAQRKKAYGCVRAVADAILQWYPRASVHVEQDIVGGNVRPFNVYISNYGVSRKEKDKVDPLNPMAHFD